MMCLLVNKVKEAVQQIARQIAGKKSDTIIRGLLIPWVLSVASLSEAATLEVVPSQSSVALNDSVELSIQISGLGSGAADSLGAYDLSLAYDNSRFTFESIQFGDPLLGNQLDLFGLGNISDSSVAPGSVGFLEISLDSPLDLMDFQADAFTLAVLTFSATAVGDAAIFLQVMELSDAFGNAFVADEIFSAKVSAVPIPPSLFLLLSAFAGFALMARKKPVLLSQRKTLA